MAFKVPGTGIEPAHPCERQILSLLRLPIPPPGQVTNGGNITTFALIEARPFYFFIELNKTDLRNSIYLGAF